jgi:hypothetical protein
MDVTSYPNGDWWMTETNEAADRMTMTNEQVSLLLSAATSAFATQQFDIQSRNLVVSFQAHGFSIINHSRVTLAANAIRAAFLRV